MHLNVLGDMVDQYQNLHVQLYMNLSRLSIMKNKINMDLVLLHNMAYMYM